MEAETASKESVEAVKELLKSLEARYEEEKKEMWSQINSLKNRLPLWATFVITGLFAALVQVINMALK